jgi:CheY-like chemotaxis protein
VGSAREAYAELDRAAAEDPYRVVFMDHWMPEIDGAEATRTILRDKMGLREEAGGLPPQIIIVTGFGDPGNRRQLRGAAEDAGAVGFLTKPITLSSLYDMLVETFAGGGKPRSALPQAAAPNLTGIRVLLVEDNAVNQQIAVELLTKAGAAVSIANDGSEAVAAITGIVQPPPYDIVLMDMQMPVMDGHEATRAIGSDPRYDSLPIIAMTAQAMAEERDQCLAEGMNDHITKPIDPDLLYRTVLAFAGQRVVPRASAASPPPATEAISPTACTGWAATSASSAPCCGNMPKTRPTRRPPCARRWPPPTRRRPNGWRTRSKASPPPSASNPRVKRRQSSKIASGTTGWRGSTTI